MQFEGVDLRRYLRSRGSLGIDMAVKIAHSAALELGALHSRGIIYGSLSLQNILIARGGSPIKLSDRRIDTNHPPQSPAPEQFKDGVVTPVTDIYALGLVIYMMLAGPTPFDGDAPAPIALLHIRGVATPISQLNPNITPALEAIIMKCLEKEPENRWRDGSQLASVLESHLMR
jgi:serine/threonine protein kinase